MKLFDEFEAVKFPEENLIFVTKNKYLYYIYNPKYKHWKKYSKAGHLELTIEKYQEITREEIIEALHGVFPKSEAFFWRQCRPSELYVYQMMALLKEDYPKLMSDELICDATEILLDEADVLDKVHRELKELFDKAIELKNNKKQVLEQIIEKSRIITGRDIYKKEIGIVDGHDSSSYFWIMPVRVYDYSDTHNWDNVAEFKHVEISIEEDDVAQYLTPFLYKYYDDELEANKNRIDYHWEDENGIEQCNYVSGFEWYLTHNFYTYESVVNMLQDIKDTIDALSTGKENEFTTKLKEKRGTSTHELIYARNMSDKEIEEYNASRPKYDDTESELIIDFYQRFIYRMEYMIKIGKERGYNLISVMGP